MAERRPGPSITITWAARFRRPQHHGGFSTSPEGRTGTGWHRGQPGSARPGIITRSGRWRPSTAADAWSLRALAQQRAGGALAEWRALGCRETAMAPAVRGRCDRARLNRRRSSGPVARTILIVTCMERGGGGEIRRPSARNSRRPFSPGASQARTAAEEHGTVRFGL